MIFQKHLKSVVATAFGGWGEKQVPHFCTRMLPSNGMLYRVLLCICTSTAEEPAAYPEMEAVVFPKMLVNLYQTRWHHFPEESGLQSSYHDSFKIYFCRSHICILHLAVFMFINI
jgi:hypothetical protein